MDQSISLDCIKENISSKVKILDIQRLNARVVDNGKASYVPSRTICIKFGGQTLPPEVALFNVLYKVDAFVPRAKICYACYRVGHISRDCKSTRPRCLFCGKSREEDHSCPVDQSKALCINCGGEHLATSHVCPYIIRYKSVINLAAQENIPLIEARRIVSPHLPPFSTPQDSRLDFMNFPYRRSPTSSSQRGYNPPLPGSSSNFIKHPYHPAAALTSNRFQHLSPGKLGSSDHPASYANAVSFSRKALSDLTVTSRAGKPSICSIENLKDKYRLVQPMFKDRPSANA